MTAARDVAGWLIVATSVLLATRADAADLRYGVKVRPALSGNPYITDTSRGDVLTAAVFDGLTVLDRTGQIAPALATRWQRTSPTTWEFGLRKGVAFSNGEPFDAEAVVAALGWLRSPDGEITEVGRSISNISGAEALDDYTVAIRTARPDALLPARLAGVMIVAPHAWSELGPDVFARSPAGTGAFTAHDLGNEDKLILAAQVDSWRRPKADRLVVSRIPDDATRVRALTGGQIEIAENIGVDDVDRLEAMGYLTAVAPATAVGALALRQVDAHAALQDVRVRQALNDALDLSAISKTVLHGFGKPAGQPAARGVAGYNPDVAPYSYDPEKAKALLVEAGYANGLSLRVDVAVDRFPSDRAVYQAVAAQLAKVGVTVDLHVGAPGPEADAMLLPFEAAPFNDVARALERYSCLAPMPVFCDKALTAQLGAANMQLDTDQRVSQLMDLAQAYHDAAPAIFLMEEFDLFGISRKVEGFALANGMPVFERMSVRK